MKHHYTEAGTKVLEPTKAEFDAMLDKWAQNALGVSFADFRKRYLAGEIDPCDERAADLVPFVRMGPEPSG